MKFIKDNWLIIVIVFLFGGNLIQYLNPIIETKEVIKRDTVTTVIVDSVSLIRAKAELNYLRSQKGKIKYVTKKEIIRDTILVNDTEFIVPHFEARVDTTFEKGNYLTALYKYPQNEFTILHKYPYVNTTVKETVEVKKLFDFSHGIIAGAFVTPQGIVQLGIGYGFKIGINL